MRDLRDPETNSGCVYKKYEINFLIIKIKNNFNIFLKNTFKIIIFLMFAHKQV
jgi:hypothetical protein